MSYSNIQSRFDQLNRFHIFLILTVLGFLAYANAVNHPFVHDDVVFIQQNPYINDLNPKNIFIQTSVPNDKFPLVNQYYRPFLEVTNRVLNKVFRLNPHGFHFFNVVLHILNSFLVYNLVRFITGNKKKLSLISAVLFLIHPVQNEAVACISGISNLVFAFLCLMSFYAYLASTHSQGNKKPLYGASLILFFFALLTKEQSVILPFLIIGYELCFVTGISKVSYKKAWRIAGFFIVLAGYFLLRKILFGFALTPVADSSGELWLRLLAIPRSLLTYLSLIFFPHNLHYYRSQDVLLPYMGSFVLMSMVVAAVILVVSRMPQPQKRWMIFGLGWFIVSLGPMLNIVPLVNEYSLILTAEHFLYFPIIGILFFVSGLGYGWIEQRKDKKSFLMTFAVFGIISVIFGGMVIRQNTYWRGEIPLFERTLQFEKNFGRVHFLLAKSYFSAGRFQDSLEEGRKALEIMEGYTRKVKDKRVEGFYLSFIKGIHYHIGLCLDILGDPQGSLVHFNQALSLAEEDGKFHYAVGLAYLKTDNIPNAVTHFEKALALDENNLMAMNSLAICYQKTGKKAEAENLLRMIVEKDSQSVSAKQNLEKFLKEK